MNYKSLTNEPSGTVGIYKIINLINNRIYVGQSVNLRCRCGEHFNDLRKNKHCIEDMQKDFNEVGIDNFKFEVIVNCKKEELNDLEMYWIDSLNAQKLGYNTTLGYLDNSMKYDFIVNKCKSSKLEHYTQEEINALISKGKTGYRFSDESKLRMRLSHLGKKPSDYNRQRLVECNTGRQWSEESRIKSSKSNKSSYINEDIIRSIKIRLQQGVKVKLIALEYSVSLDIVYNIKNEKTWKWVKI